MRIMAAVLVALIVGTAALFADTGSVNVHSFVMDNIDGDPVSLAEYKGKVLLIVNTASRCGFTPQYRSLEALYQKYQDRGFEVLAFPANNFRNQEPGTNEEIREFCQLNYRTTFPLFARSSVAGEDMNPLYAYLTQKSPFSGAISWNFNKFLIGPDGNVVARFDSPTDPLSKPVIERLEAVLPR